jgi:glycosyltransferase involved in cell wall biosynthesis
MVKALYFSFSGYSDHNGISKKKLAQINGLKQCGCSVVNCYYTVNPENGDRMWMTDDKVLVNLGRGIRAKITKRIDYKPIFAFIREQQIELVYMRSEHNANPFLIRFVKKLRDAGVKIVMEIPTYPYDQEYSTLKGKFHLSIDRVFRKQLAQTLNAIVTFSEEKVIFGQRTIQISNGIDFSTIRMKQIIKKPGELHLIGVAEIHFWHGFDRIIAGLRDYYNRGDVSSMVYFHIVGEFSGIREKNEILPLITDNNLENYVTLHGRQFGAELDRLFDLADLGIGSLARHRSGITFIKTLKNREYAARGIPFIYSEMDTDFDAMEYVFKVPADESPVDIERVIDFFIRMNETPEQIRDSIRHLSWRNQMQRVLESIE